MSAPAEDQEQPAIAEDVPDGSFGHARPLIRLPANFTPCTPDEQRRHVAALVDELAQFAVGPAIRRLKEPSASQGTA